MEWTMSKAITRKRFLASSTHWVAGATAFLSLRGLTACSENQEETSTSADSSGEQVPKRAITRIKMTTIGATDLTPVEDWYTNWLGYSVAERGEISEAVAGSWGTPNMAGRPYILMQPESGAASAGSNRKSVTRAPRVIGPVPRSVRGGSHRSSGRYRI